LLFISNTAPYMKKANDCPKLIHMTCKAHTLHTVCEEVLTQFQDVNQLIGEMKIKNLMF